MEERNLMCAVYYNPSLHVVTCMCSRLYLNVLQTLWNLWSHFGGSLFHPYPCLLHSYYYQVL